MRSFMRFFVQPRAAALAVAACVALTAGVAPQQGPANDLQDGTYETTGSVNVTAGRQSLLPLSDEQRERVYRGLLAFPDAPRTDAPAPDVADRLSGDAPLEELPPGVVEETPQLRGHKFVKLDDRILLVEPQSRTVVAMLPRYKLLP
jgi:hypothetical protein